MGTKEALIGYSADWRAEMHAQWAAEDAATGEIDRRLRVAVDAARAYTVRELHQAFVFWDALNEHEPFGWCSEHQYKVGGHQWVKAEEVLYSTWGGWYEQPPVCVAWTREE